MTTTRSRLGPIDVGPFHTREQARVLARRKARACEAEKAANALANLTVFAAVAAMLEGGTITADCSAASGRIIRACRTEQDRQLRAYDKHMEAVNDAK